MTYFNNLGQGRLGWRSPSAGGGGITPSTLWNSIYSVYNADSVGSSSLKTSLFAVYNGESNANDSFGSNNGTAVGGLTYTTGKIGNAFTFNGSTSYVSLPNDSLNFTGDFTVNAWFNTSTYSGYRGVASSYKVVGSLAYGWIAYHEDVTNQFALYFRDGSNTMLYRTNGGIPANSYYMITWVRKVGQDPKIYINGVLSLGAYTFGNSSSNPSYQTGQPCNLGGWNNTSYGNHKQDATNIWQRTLTQSEITELYNSGNGAQYITNDFYKPTTNDALNTYNGTAQGGLTYGVGKVGTAFVFNGTNAYVSLPDNSFNFTNDFTASAWVYLPTNTRTNIGIIGNYDFAAPGGWGLTTNSTGTLYARVSNENGRYSASASSAIAINDWTHVVMVFKKGTGFYAYANGVLVAQFTLANNASAGKSPNPSTKARIGLLNYSGDWWWMPNGGRIDACNVWDRALTTSEITELYNSGNGKQYPN